VWRETPYLDVKLQSTAHKYNRFYKLLEDEKSLLVLETLFRIGCKSAKILFMGFLWLVGVLVDLNFTTKALFA